MKLWLPRLRQDSISTKQLLEVKGIDVYIEPLLELYVYTVEIPNIKHNQLIFSSFNGIKSYISNNNNIDYTIPVYVVGNKTLLYAKSLGFDTVIMELTIELLILRLCKDVKPFSSKLYYGRGLNISFDIKKALSLKGYNIYEQNLYDCKYVSCLSDELQLMIRKSQVIAVVFTSVRMAKSFVRMVRTYNLDNYIKKMLVFCISDNIAKELMGICSNIHISEEPTLLSLLDCINKEYIK